MGNSYKVSISSTYLDNGIGVSLRKRVVAGLLAAVLGSGAVFAVGFHTPPGPRSLRHFEPDRLADLELGMWQAYYRKQRLRLFSLLVITLREQYRYTWARAGEAGFHLARAAASFGEARGGDERVLPDLERAYAIARDWSSADFNPGEVARAELEWWVARRDPARKSPASVGALIAREYSLLYEVPLERVAEAGRLRAEAGALRDAGGSNADWPEVARLLRDSYRRLHAAVSGDKAPGPRGRDLSQACSRPVTPKVVRVNAAS